MATKSNTMKHLYAVVRIYISSSDASCNGQTDVELFNDRSDALVLFRSRRDEEFQFRVESGAAYEVLQDSENKFQIAWDSCLEMMVLSLKECEVQ